MWYVRIAVAVLILSVAVPARAQDLRDQFGTQSLEAAKAIDQTIKLVQMKKAQEAVTVIEGAIKADPRSQMAHYWHAISLIDSGDVEGAMDAYKTALSDKVNRSQKLSASVAFNLAITNAKLKEFDEANIWFTRAIMEDPTNKFKERGKAYRNLAITLRNQNKPFSAAVAVSFAYEDNTPNTPIQMVQDFFSAVGKQETARILHFRDESPKLEKREKKASLANVALGGDIALPIQTLLSDPAGRYVIAWPRGGADHYFLIDTITDKLTVAKVDLPGKCDHPCLTENALYAVLGKVIAKIEVATGKQTANYSIGDHAATSLAVLPTQNRAYFAADKVIHEVNLKTAKIQKTAIPGQLVVAHPNQQSVFTWLRPERIGGGGHIIVNGKPMFFRTGTIDWSQTLLFKAQLVSSGLLVAEVRENVASNAVQMSISPDGHWIAVAGGGGWRPSSQNPGFGYGVAVFGTANLEHVQGFFNCDAYPRGVSFNPVTNQVIALREQDGKVYHLSDNKESATIKGKFAGPSAWSGNGKFLFLAKQDGGVIAFANDLSADEHKLAAAWFERIVITPLDSSQGAIKPTFSFTPVAGYEKFEIGKLTRGDLAAALAKVINRKPTDRPGPWNAFADYQNPKVTEVIEDARENLGKQKEFGIAIFKLKKAMKENEKSVPLKFYLAEALRQGNQSAEAEKLLVEVVRLDAGRTNLSCLALNNLATVVGERDDSLPALHCLAHSLYLDCANPQTISRAAPLLKKHKFYNEAEKIAKLASGSAPMVFAGFPKLPAPATVKKLSASEIYQKAAWSIVLIKTNNGSGSGFCVGSNDIIVTNNHVVGNADSVEVYPFIIKDKASVKMPMIRGQVVYRSDTEDIAVLKLEKAPDHLAPLFVAAGSPSPGEKVCAIGSPGLGKQILEQSISEGLVSSKNRMIDNTVYLQHSAPVNPGNSGGPLLDENCNVVGVVTLNARLANVSFAIPAETLRTIFKSP